MYAHTQRFMEGPAFCFCSAFLAVFFPSPRALHPAQGRRCRGAWSAWAAFPSSQPAGHLGGFWKEPAGAGGPLGILMELARGGACTQETQAWHLSQARVGPGGLGSHPGARDVLRCGLWLRRRNGAAVPSFLMVHVTTDQDSWTHDFAAPHPHQHVGLHGAALDQHDSPLPFTVVCAQHAESQPT